MKKFLAVLTAVIICLTFCGCNVNDKEGSACKNNNHDFVTYVYDNNATCFADGTETARCSNIYCSATHTRVKQGSKLSHSLEHYSATGNTCCKAGYIEHYLCTLCLTAFSDENATQVIENKDLYLELTNKPIVSVNETESTCCTKGLLAHFECSVCHTLYADINGETEITLSSIYKPLSDHIYDGKEITVNKVSVKTCRWYDECGKYEEINTKDDPWWTPNI